MAYYRSEPAPNHYTYAYNSSRSERSNYPSDLGSPRSWTAPAPHLRREGSGRRRRWPPSPSVEDEVESLAREHPLRRRDIDDGDVCSRGSIDQEPLLIELYNDDRRFVLVSDPGVKTSKYEGRKGRSKKKRSVEPEEKKTNKGYPDLKLDVEETNMFDRRKPSPYAYTRTSSHKVSGDYFISPEALTAPAANIPRSTPGEAGMRSPRREFTNDSLTSSASNSRTDYSDDSDLDVKEAAARPRSRPTSARPSFVGLNSHRRNVSFGDELNALGHPPFRMEAPRSPVSSNPTKYSDSIPEDRSATPTMSNATMTRGSGSSNSIPIRRSTRSDSTYGSSPSKKDSLRHVSVSGSYMSSNSPPSSPKLDGGIAPSSPRANASSRPNSRPSSPQSPYDPYFPGQTERSPLYRTASKEVNPKQPSKLSSSMRPDSTDGQPRTPRIDIHSPNPARPITSLLPYPDDDQMFAMPSEEKYQARADGIGLVVDQRPQRPRSSSAVSNSLLSNVSRGSSSQRPESSSRQQSIVDPPRSEPSSRHLSIVDSEESRGRVRARSRSSSLPSKPLLQCPRQRSSREYDEWRTLDRFADFNVCSACFEHIIQPSPFRIYFEKASPRSSSVASRCDFGSPWARAAWLLTHKDQRQDMSFIYALGKNLTSEKDCPGSEEAVGTWYGLQDETGAFIPGFAICPRDKANVEALFPSLVGVFSRLSSSRLERTCSFYAGSKRFASYVDILDKINDKALDPSRSSRSRSPIGRATTSDIRPFIDLAKSFPHVRQCQRDRVIEGMVWHYIPEYPDFTVCPECFLSKVRPAVKTGSPVALLFTPTPQLLPPTMTAGGAGAASAAVPLRPPQGQSCQLYSSRMRRIFDAAVREESGQYLVRKARERREIELELKKQRIDLKRLMSASTQQYYGGGIDRDRLKRDLEKVDREWENWE